MESENPAFIRVFIQSEKTVALFNSIALAEKQKYIQFLVLSMEPHIDGGQSNHMSS